MGVIDYNTHRRDVLFQLFEVVDSVVWSQGGDGEGYIITNDVKEMAALYAEYVKVKQGNFLAPPKFDTDEIYFMREQEWVCFRNNREGTQFADIVVEIDYRSLEAQKYLRDTFLRNNPGQEALLPELLRKPSPEFDNDQR